MTTVKEVWRAGVTALRDAGIDGAERDAQALMANALGCEAYQVSIQAPERISDVSRRKFEGFVDQRLARMPVSRILGSRWFYRHEFEITKAVLDPRPETECLVERGIEYGPKRILELGTGSGCIVISILDVLTSATAVATDISPDAVLVAGENAAKIGVADRLTLPISDWYDDIGGRFDLIVSNPPYIAAAEMDALEPEVRHFDPRAALTDEADGLSAYRKITAGAKNHLVPGGHLLVEIGATQADAVSQLFRAAGLVNVDVFRDLDGRDRVVAGTSPDP